MEKNLKGNLKGNFGLPSHRGNSLRKELAPQGYTFLPLRAATILKRFQTLKIIVCESYARFAKCFRYIHFPFSLSK